MSKRGIALVISFVVILVLTMLGAAVISRSVTESLIVQRHREAQQAFWLAEAGLNRALLELRSGFSGSSANCKWTASLGAGRYCADLGALDGTAQNRLVTAHGCVPDEACNSSRIQRIVEATMTKVVSPGPDHFFDNAIYSPGNVNISGSAYSITGDVRYGGTITPNPPTNIPAANNIHDASITDLARFDFDQLRTMSHSQGNLHDVTHNPAFPVSFWNSPGVPNIVFIDGDFDISGKKQVVGGFIVVGGDTLYDAEVAGNAAVDGVIYTQGTCSVLGGGGVPFNVNGGIWAGEGVVITGSTIIEYNSVYMNALFGLNLFFTVQISNWNDTQNPYTLQD